MNPTSETAKNNAAAPLSDLSQLIIALGHPNRWKILKELTGGFESWKENGLKIVK